MKSSTPKQPIKSLIIRMDDDLFQALRERSFLKNESRAEIVRQALHAFLKK